MTLAAPQNSDLPVNWLIPGIYIQLDLRGSAAGLGNVAKRILVIGHKTSTGIAALNTVYAVQGQGQANLMFGRGSDAARMFAAAQSQIGGGAADIEVVAVPEPTGGTAATHLITFVGTASAADAVTVIICGYQTSVGIANLDTPQTIAANLAQAINAMPDIPVTAQAIGATVVLSYRHVGVVGNDLPVIVNFAGGSGVRASPGTFTFNGAGAGAGSAIVSIGSKTVQAAIASGNTGDNIAQALAAQFALDSYPCTAEATTGGVLTLFYAADRVVQRLSAAIFGTTGITVTPAIGTAGAGVPSLVQALSNLEGQAAFPCWITSYTDVGSLGAIFNHIERQGDGRRQKDQMLFVCSTDTLARAGAIPVGTSPELTGSPRYVVGWCPDSPQQAYELGARMAARVCVEDFHPYNYDGEPLKTDDVVPLLLPHQNSRPGQDDANAAIGTYYLTPLTVDEQAGQLVILRDRTTSNSTDDRLWGWGTIRTLSFYRYDLNGFLRSRFAHKNLKLVGTPKTPNTVNVSSIIDAIYERMRQWDDADMFDGADSAKGQIRVSPNPLNTSRVDIFVPCRPPRKLDQLSGVAGLI